MRKRGEDTKGNFLLLQCYESVKKSNDWAEGNLKLLSSGNVAKNPNKVFGSAKMKILAQALSAPLTVQEAAKLAQFPDERGALKAIQNLENLGVVVDLTRKKKIKNKLYMRTDAAINYVIEVLKVFGKHENNQGSELSSRAGRKKETKSDWNFNAALARVKDFVTANHHARIPASLILEDGFALGSWVSKRRQDKKAGRLSADRIEMLETVPGWQWEVEQGTHTDEQKKKWDDAFEAAFQKLRSYVAENGHAQVPSSFRTSDGFALGLWVANNRIAKRKGRLSDLRLKQFEAVPGWLWEESDDAFEDALQHLISFVVENGHTRVPHGHVTHGSFPLGTWVAKQKRENTHGILSEARVRMLEAVPNWRW